LRLWIWMAGAWIRCWPTGKMRAVMVAGEDFPCPDRFRTL